MCSLLGSFVTLQQSFPRRGIVELFVWRVGCTSGLLSVASARGSGVSSFGVWRSGHAQCGEDFHCSL